MDKLVQLLNEYDDACEYTIIDGDMKRRVRDFNYELNTWKQVVWYTKKFGFVRRLIENDKIDKEKIIMAETLPITDINEDYLLMLLAIQDDPISTLSFILK